ncbi:unnamed protein product [Rotaria socialis]|uniref:Uncharacterized protein n=1 Tax=Rotaria socialis TaxID=392032 RepID=A0A821V165_9BILA|nr:unnamed protein product [Rotaria socialis]CAF4899103.1 unnamed protein product [Rotaria socialis]
MNCSWVPSTYEKKKVPSKDLTCRIINNNIQQHSRNNIQQQSRNNLQQHSRQYNSKQKLSLQPNTSINEQALPSPFYRNLSVRQAIPTHTQYNRILSSSTTTTSKYVDDKNEILSYPSLTKVYMNKSFPLRRQCSSFILTNQYNKNKTF